VKPSARSGHTMNVYGDKMFIFGGIFELTKELNDLISYDFLTGKFQLVGSDSMNLENSFLKSNNKMREESPTSIRRAGTFLKSVGVKNQNNFTSSPNKKNSTQKLTNKARRAILSPTKVGEVEDTNERDKHLQSPTSISMKKSFLISNADASFDSYYQSQIKKKEKKMGQ
jgi:hypothetical protein